MTPQPSTLNSQPICAGSQGSPIRARLLGIIDDLDFIARALLTQTDADDATCLWCLQAHESAQALKDRVTDDEPAALRHPVNPV